MTSTHHPGRGNAGESAPGGARAWDPGLQNDQRRERRTVTRRPTRLRDAALAAADFGLHVFPCIPHGKTPAVSGWEQAATRDRDQITAWWSEGPPYNIGAAAGPSGLVVIDLDDGHGDPAPEPFAGATGGRDVLAMLAERAGEPVPFDTWTVSTPTGGAHLYYQAPAGVRLRNSAGALGWKIDTRAHGGYIVAAGSAREQGYYRPANTLSIAELPAWLVIALTPAAPVLAATSGSRELSRTRASAYVRAIVERETHGVATAQVGQRHHTRLKAARTLGRLVGGQEMAEHEAMAALRDAACLHIGTDCTEAEVDNDLRDGLAYGRRLPRRITQQEPNPA